MKKYLLILLALMLMNIAAAQVLEKEADLKTLTSDSIDGWKIGGMLIVNFNQTSLTNWAAGGQNSFATNSMANLYARYKKGNGLWENYLDLGYGGVRRKEENWRKTDDKIDFTSKYGQKASENWYYAALLNFRSQFSSGYNYPDDSTKISDFLAPGYMIAALGMDYKQGENFTLFLSPLTSKTTFVRDQNLANVGAFGVEPGLFDSTSMQYIIKGKTAKQEVGGYIRVFYKIDIMENVSMQSKMDLFSNYLKDPQNIDVNWETLITMKVNKFISASLFAHLIYDNDIKAPEKNGPRAQFKEVLGIGFAYKF